MRALVGVPVVAAAFLAGGSAAALTWDKANDLYVRVVDVGPGLCTISVAPGGHVMIYDAGRWTNHQCSKAVDELAPPGSKIDLLVISHMDSDHLAEVPAILANHDVERILHTGDWRDGTTRDKARSAIAAEVTAGAAEVNLGSTALAPGKTYAIGPAEATFVAGWHEWTDDPGDLDDGELVNAISIVIHLEYSGRSILFTGDTVGRHRSDPDNDACGYAEKAMVDNAAQVPIESDVMTAPHHGGNNSSTPCFLDAIGPKYVIFSAGHDYEHPAQKVAERYLAANVALRKLFRTDRKDNEGGYEWKYGALRGCSDQPGDDDVEVVITKAGKVSVAYRERAHGC